MLKHLPISLAEIRSPIPWRSASPRSSRVVESQPVDIPPAQRLTNRQKKCAPIGTSRPGILCSSQPLRRSAACANLLVGLARAMGKLAGRKTATITRYVPMIAIIDGGSRAYGIIVLDFPRCRSGRGTIEEALWNAGKAARPWRRGNCGRRGTAAIRSKLAHPVVVTGDGRGYGACDCAFATRATASGQSQSVDRRRVPSIDATAAAHGLTCSVSCRAPLGRRSKNEG